MALSHAQTKRIGVTSLLRPSSNWNLRRPLVSRSCQRTSRRRRVVFAPDVFVSTCSQTNHVGNIGAATPRGIPSRASADVGGVRNERRGRRIEAPLLLEHLLEAHGQARLWNAS